MEERAERIQELVTFLASSLVDNPEAVSVTSERDGDQLFIMIAVDEADTGKIIGRSGRTIKSIRTLARAAAGDSPLQVDVDVEG